MYANFASVLAEDVPAPFDAARYADGPRLVRKEMWLCRNCGCSSFVSRMACFGCGARRPNTVQLVEEWWRSDALGGKGKGKGKADEGKGVAAWLEEGKGKGRKGSGKDMGGGSGGGKGRGGRTDRARPGKAEEKDATEAGPGNAPQGDRLKEQRSGGHKAEEGKRGWNRLAEGQTWSDALDEEYTEDNEEEEEEEGHRVGERRWGKGRTTKPQKKGNKTKGAERKRKQVQAHENEEDAGSVESGKEEAVQGNEQDSSDDFPKLQEAYEGLVLPRVILAARAEALEARTERLRVTKPDDPRTARGEELLEETKAQLRAAGGRTPKRLFFGLADGVDRIKKREKAVKEAEERHEEAKSCVEKAIREEQRTWAWVEVERQKLENEKARQAHWGFAAAAEAGQLVEGYASLETAVQKIQCKLAQSGTDATDDVAKAFGLVANFIYKFGKLEYEEDADPVLQEIKSTPSCSEATILCDNGSETTVDWREAEARAEEETLARGLGEHAPEAALQESQQLLQQVRQAAACGLQRGLEVANLQAIQMFDIATQPSDEPRPTQGRGDEEQEKRAKRSRKEDQDDADEGPAAQDHVMGEDTPTNPKQHERGKEGEGETGGAPGKVRERSRSRSSGGAPSEKTKQE